MRGQQRGRLHHCSFATTAATSASCEWHWSNRICEGPVATFGSIVVNGVRYDTNSAVFTIDDAPGLQNDLRVGNVVTVQGTIDDNGTTGIAEEVTLDDLVKGPVESINIAGKLNRSPWANRAGQTRDDLR